MHTSSIMLQIHSYWHGDLSSRDQWSHHMRGLHLTTGSNLSIPSRGTMDAMAIPTMSMDYHSSLFIYCCERRMTNPQYLGGRSSTL